MKLSSIRPSPNLKTSGLNLVIAATPDHITMVEGGCTEISEDDLLGALAFGHQEIRKICAIIKEIREKLGKAKAPIILAPKFPTDCMRASSSLPNSS